MSLDLLYTFFGLLPLESAMKANALRLPCCRYSVKKSIKLSPTATLISRKSNLFLDNYHKIEHSVQNSVGLGCSLVGVRKCYILFMLALTQIYKINKTKQK